MSTSGRSPGPHSKAVHSAPSVTSVGWERCFVMGAETVAADKPDQGGSLKLSDLNEFSRLAERLPSRR